MMHGQKKHQIMYTEDARTHTRAPTGWHTNKVTQT